MDEISYDLFTQERKRRSKKMASLKDAAERQAFSGFSGRGDKRIQDPADGTPKPFRAG